jgi:hypothetical protein
MATTPFPENAPHPHPMPWFEANRREIYNFIATELGELLAAGKRHILVYAPVKAGKRELAECISVSYRMNVTHYFVTSLNRKDVKTQKVELDRYGIRTCVISEDRDAVLADIRADIAARRRVVMVVDESDYGSGSKQKLTEVHGAFLDHPQVAYVYFSATPEETESSALADREDYAELEFVPPVSYCGAQYFVEEDLVFAPEPFLDNDEGNLSVSRHGLDVIRDSITEERHIGVVRVTGIPQATLQNERVKEALTQQLGTSAPNGRPWEIKVITDKSPLEWENRIMQRGYCMDTDKNHLFFLFQTCTRGTDLKGWHPKLAFWHDARSCKNSNLNTLVQALLRPSHYSAMSGYGGRPQPIRLYVDQLVMEYAAYGDLQSYIAAGGKQPTRTRKARGPRLEYDIRETANFADLAGFCAVTGQAAPSLDSYPLVDGFRQIAGFGVSREERVLHTWAYADASRRLRLGYDRVNFFFVPCYRDVTDPRTLVWFAVRRTGQRQRQRGTPIETTNSSMYAGAGRV